MDFVYNPRDFQKIITLVKSQNYELSTNHYYKLTKIISFNFEHEAINNPKQLDYATEAKIIEYSAQNPGKYNAPISPPSL